MANLKEIRGRIGSVGTTLKITSAMSLIASAKLHSAQNAVANMVPYEKGLRNVLQRLLEGGARLENVSLFKGPQTDGEAFESGEAGTQAYETGIQASGRTAVVVVSSNQSLCGSFNANILRAFDAMELDPASTVVYAAGKFGLKHISKAGFEVVDICQMSGKPDYAQSAALAEQLCADFAAGRISRVLMLYAHFVSASSQKVTTEQYLPFELSQPVGPEPTDRDMTPDLILEPDADAMLEMLVPKILRLRLHTVLMDAATAEHAARTMAMQTATDNAKDLLSELSLQYNKLRQQAITAEILDLLGGQTNN